MGTKFFVSETVLVGRPVEQVFAYATDYRNDVHWRQGVTAMTVEPEGPSGVGTKTKEVMRSYGRSVHTLAEITLFEKNRRADFLALEGPIAVSGSRIFEARGEQTLVTYSIGGELDAFYSLLWPLLRKSFQRQIAGDLQRLKHVLEAEASQRAPAFSVQ